MKPLLTRRTRKTLLALPVILLVLATALTAQATILDCRVPNSHSDKKALYVELSEKIGLNYSKEFEIGAHRLLVKKGEDGERDEFLYLNKNKDVISSKEDLQRFEKLGLPPAWVDVQISADPTSHVQAIGTDAKGRKQYTYHRSWVEIRNAVKFSRMNAFGHAVDTIRGKTAHDLALKGLPFRKVQAVSVELLERTLIRIGNEGYAKENKSYGLTTVLKSDVHRNGNGYLLTFFGKHQVPHTKGIQNPRLVRLVSELMKIPGENLLQYLDGEGKPHTIDSTEVNSYIREISEGNFTAKDFRTWMGTVYAAEFLANTERPKNEKQIKEVILEITRQVADKLGNEPSESRDSYIHPLVFELYRERKPFDRYFAKARNNLPNGATKHEVAEEAVRLMTDPN